MEKYVIAKTGSGGFETKTKTLVLTHPAYPLYKDRLYFSTDINESTIIYDDQTEIIKLCTGLRNLGHNELYIKSIDTELENNEWRN